MDKRHRVAEAIRLSFGHPPLSETPTATMGERWLRAADAAIAATEEKVRHCCFRCQAEDIERLPLDQQINAARAFAPCECGNKRCPKSTWHENACTGSNEVGQPGSAWEHV